MKHVVESGLGNEYGHTAGYNSSRYSPEMSQNGGEMDHGIVAHDPIDIGFGSYHSIL
jgi:hypothetical protein